jgi:hypothetical protein
MQEDWVSGISRVVVLRRILVCTGRWYGDGNDNSQQQVWERAYAPQSGADQSFEAKAVKLKEAVLYFSRIYAFF